jgi:hypothetical protein
MAVVNTKELLIFFILDAALRQVFMEMRSLKGPLFIPWMTDEFAALVEG